MSADIDTRKTAPIAAQYVKPSSKSVLIDDYQRARELLRSPKVRQAGAGTDLLDISRTEEVGLFYLDGEAHRKKRAVISRYFTLRIIETRYHDIMVRTTDRLLAKLQRDGTGHLDKMGFELAVAVASEVIGLDHSDLEGLAVRVAATQGAADGRLPVKDAGDDAIRTFFETDVKPSIALRRANRGEDVISRLLDDGWSDRAILTEVIAYSVAGMATTREFLAMTAWYLFERPEMLERFKTGSEDEQFAILEEVLRLEPIVGALIRHAAEDIDSPVCGHIPKGSRIVIDVRAANMDESATGPCPHMIDPDRAKTTPDRSGFMSFGDGPHRCPGAQLSFHEARIFFEKLFAIPGIKLEKAPSIHWYRPISGYELHDAIITCDKVKLSAMSSVWRDDPDAATSVLSNIDKGVAVVTLNRPERLNAWTPQMGTLYFDILERHAADPEVRVILVTGAGRGFCAGADVGGLEDMSAAGGRGQLADKRPYSLPMTIGKPLVAAINGPCVGIGVQQALCCDVRFAATDAKLAVAFARFGLVAEAGMSWNMTRLVGAGVAMDLMLSGRTVGAEEALRLGLVSHVSPPERLIDDAMAYCRTLADKCSPWSMRMIKQQIYRDMLSDLPSAYGRSETLLDESFARADFTEAVKAFGEKRAPAFDPLAAELGKLDKG